VEMLEQIGKTGILERFGWHAQAWGLTIKLDNLDTFRQQVKEYEKNISSDDLEKVVYVDTMIESQDLLSEDIYQLDLLAPFWEANPAPTFLLKDVDIKKVDLVWKEKKHLKIYAKKDGVDVVLLKWSWLKLLDKIKSQTKISCIVSYAKDDFNWGFYFKIIDLV
jgi:single-stranded DNA-specific DHH superfamily exonuclease